MQTCCEVLLHTTSTLAVASMADLMQQQRVGARVLYFFVSPVVTVPDSLCLSVTPYFMFHPISTSCASGVNFRVPEKAFRTLTGVTSLTHHRQQHLMSVGSLVAEPEAAELNLASL